MNRYRRKPASLPTAALSMAVAAILAAALPSAAQELPLSSLEEVLNSTLERHEALKIAAEDVEQAQLRKKRFLMTLTPDITFSGYGRKIGGGSGAGGGGGNGEGENGGILILPDGTYYGYNVSLTQPIYTGGRALAAYRGAGDFADSTVLGEELTRRDLIAAAAESYYAVLAAMETVRIGEQAVVSSGRHLELAKRRLELGEGLVTDKLRAEVTLSEVQSNLIRFRNALADTRAGVHRLAGRPLSEAPRMIEFLAVPEGGVDALIDEALAARLEIEQARLTVQAAEQDVREKKGRFMPALFAAANYSGAGEEIGDQVTGWDAGLFVEFPIYQRASRFYLLKESRSALRQAELAGGSRAKDIALEVSRLYNAYKASEAQIETLRKQVELAAENLRLAEKRFAVGLADSIELVDTQTADLSSRVGLTAETLIFEVAKLRLYKALGRDLFPEMVPGETAAAEGSFRLEAGSGRGR